MAKIQTVKHKDLIVDLNFTRDNMNVSLWTKSELGGYMYHGEHNFSLPIKSKTRNVIPALVNK